MPERIAYLDSSPHPLTSDSRIQTTQNRQNEKVTQTDMPNADAIEKAHKIATVVLRKVNGWPSNVRNSKKPVKTATSAAT